MSTETCLQITYGPEGHCFGCGPKNRKGLRLESFVEGDEVVCRWHGRPEHEAFAGTLNGGIVGTLFDCHSNWTAAHHLWQTHGGEFPSTVTAEFHVLLQRMTPSTEVITLRAKVVESSGQRATVEARIEAGGKQTATCRGVFVAIPPGHPAYHRWT